MAKNMAVRLKIIQRHLGVEADGILGNQTLSALEARLFSPVLTTSAPIVATTTLLLPMTLSTTGIAQLVQHEISSESYYQAKLAHPTWPGGESGVTIGIGYDLGYCSVEQFERDWQTLLSPANLTKLTSVCGIKASAAKAAVSALGNITIPLTAAKQVFTQGSLPLYAKKTQQLYPGIEQLAADAQTALVSLVYNRGTSIKGDTRREMAVIQPLVLQQNYAAIAEQISNMKRLWQDKGLDGLLKRRDDEAKLVAQAERNYRADELVIIS